MFGSTGSDIDLHDCVQQRKLVLFDLNKGTLGRDAELVASIVLVVMHHVAFSRLSVPESDRFMFPLIIDEFNSLASVHELVAPGLNEYRKLSVPVVLSGQSLTGMDRSMRSTILTNCAVRCCFRMDADNIDIVTAELRGDERELMRQRLGRLDVGESLVFTGGKSPRQVSIDYLPTPSRLTQAEQAMICRIYSNAGSLPTVFS